MKTFLKFSGIISFVIAVVAFILMLAGTAVSAPDADWSISGAKAIFGYDVTASAFGFSANVGHMDGAVIGVFAFIFVIVALVILCAGVILPILKVTALDKISGVLNLVAVILLILAGVFCFIVKSSWISANDLDALADSYSLGAGMIIAGILSIAAGVVAVCPAIANLVSKR